MLNGILPSRFKPPIQSLVVFFLCFPIFFQLSGPAIFNSPDIIYNSYGQLSRLPLPLSILSCFIGIILLAHLKAVKIAIIVTSSLFISMLLSTILVIDNGDEWLDKAVLIAQFTLPVFALILGQSYQQPDNRRFHLEALFLYVLLFIIPLEIFATRMQETIYLAPHLYGFSIYQHMQYLPTIFVGIYFLAVVSLFQDRKLKVSMIILSPFIGVYAAASLSMLAMAMVIAGSICVVLGFFILNRRQLRFSLAVALLATTSLGLYAFEISENLKINKFRLERLSDSSGDMMVSPNVKARLNYWREYWDGITEDHRTFLLGHSRAPDRESAPSAHNYYLDLIYNFGFISAIPILALIIFTVRQIYLYERKNDNWDLDMVGLSALVLFFLLVDNSLKVGLRQPYPGIIVFFLWGVLLNRLSTSLAMINSQAPDSRYDIEGRQDTGRLGRKAQHGASER